MVARRLEESAVIASAVQERRARVVAAYYSMHSGQVEFLSV